MIAKGTRHVICGANTWVGRGCCVLSEEFTRGQRGWCLVCGIAFWPNSALQTDR